jgi:hypothetical protein
MTIGDNATHFAGLEVQDFEEGEDVTPDIAWRLRVEYEAEEPWTDLFQKFVDAPGAREVRALLVGAWGDVSTGDDSAAVVEALVAAREQFPKLEAIFFGDIMMEESEISWINQSDLSPMLSAYPKLKTFQVRGGNGLSLGALKHDVLETLIVETGGLDASVVRQIAHATLPKLTHLEVWLGSEDYGATWTMDDLGELLRGDRFPALKTLGLRDSDEADAIAAAIAKSPLLERIEVLDLSLGTLGDEGAEALLASPAVKRLKRLDLHHHYLSAPVRAKMTKLGIEVDISDEQDEGKYGRYVSVGE